MTDLEMTTLCAKAMGLQTTYCESLPLIVNNGMDAYHPLIDDAQAMALVKKFELDQRRFIDGNHKAWIVMLSDTVPASSSAYHVDLNRAICKCVANMQKQRKP